MCQRLLLLTLRLVLLLRYFGPRLLGPQFPMRLTWVVLAWFNLPRWQADAVAFAKRKAIGLRLLCVARTGLIVKAIYKSSTGLRRGVASRNAGICLLSRFRLPPESGIAPKEGGGACR